MCRPVPLPDREDRYRPNDKAQINDFRPHRCLLKKDPWECGSVQGGGFKTIASPKGMKGLLRTARSCICRGCPQINIRLHCAVPHLCS